MADPLSRSDYRLLALAGVTQAGALVHATANGEPVDRHAHAATLACIATHNAQSLAEVFVQPLALTRGLHQLSEALAGHSITPEVARYALQLISLAKRLRKSPRTLDHLGSLLTGLQGQANVSAIGHIYEETIANLGKRVQVTGDVAHLRQDLVAAEIRALLLAGVRCAWLWHQLGGRLWRLLLYRRQLVAKLGETQNKLRAY